MYHTIEFRVPRLAQVAAFGKSQLTQVPIKRGARVRAEIVPYVVESSLGPVEVADLFLEDGSTARSVRYASFRFIDE